MPTDDDDLLPPDTPPIVAVVPPAPGRQKNIVCEFCECTLAPSGDYLRLSDKAKELRKLEERIEDLKSQIEKRDKEIAELRATVARNEPHKKRGFWKTEVGSDG